MPSDDLFTPLFVPDRLREALSGRAWLQALLDAERALAVATAHAGLIPPEAAQAVAAACDAERFEPAEIAAAGRRVGNPVEPLVRALREAVGPEAGRYVHWGATSQDVLDTASVLVARAALDLILPDLDGVAHACAHLAETHRDTLAPGRTLLRQAVPTTFGFKAATWLVGVVEARRRLLTVRRERLAAQLGGAAGTLAALGERGPEVLARFAEHLDLLEPVVPWHTVRVRIAELGGALELAAGACAKVSRDVTLLAQTEVAEVAVSAAGGSSTMPQKRNPTGAVLAIACAQQVHGHAGVLSASLLQEHERAAGAWHAEWQALAGALALTGGAAAWTRDTLDGLEVDTERMRRNLDEATLSERAAFLLSERIGRDEAHELLAGGRSLREVLAEHLTPEEIDAALDPAGYVGSATVFVERALAFYREELG